MRRHLPSAVPLLSLLLLSCGPDPVAVVAVNGSPGRTFRAAAGEELEITVGTVGPGEYASPPVVSSSVLRFLDMAIVGPYEPAGPHQRFRFKADAAGQAVVLFRHTGTGPEISDTVVVH